MQIPKDSRLGRWAAGTFGLVMLTMAVGCWAIPPHMGHGPVVTKGEKMIALIGKVGGTWTHTPQAANAGEQFQLSGNGNIASLGPVRVTASLHSSTMTTDGRTTGTMTLTGTQGTLTLALSGPAQPSQANLAYTITAGTGDCLGKHGAGIAQITMTSLRRPATIPGRMTPHFIVAPMFTITFGG